MKNRKVGKCHQNVLVFYKGDTKKIQENYPNILEYEDYVETNNIENLNMPDGVEVWL